MTDEERLEMLELESTITGYKNIIKRIAMLTKDAELCAKCYLNDSGSLYCDRCEMTAIRRIIGE